MDNLKENDVVVLLKEPINSVNRMARVVSVRQAGIYVSNLNMPWQGTLCNHFIPYGSFRGTKKHCDCDRSKVGDGIHSDACSTRRKDK